MINNKYIRNYPQMQEIDRQEHLMYHQVLKLHILDVSPLTWVKVFRIIPEFRTFRLTFHRKSVSKS